MTTLAFIVNRVPFFKYYSPVIERALKQGCQVECWLRQAPPDNPKAYTIPTLENLPSFRNGQTQIRYYQKKHDCLDLISQSKTDVVISVLPKHFYFSEPTPNCRFVMLQVGIDSLINATPQKLVSSDLICLLSPFWMDWATSYYEASGQCSAQQFRKLVENKIVYTGYPQLDVIAQIKPLAIRQGWGIAQGKPVVLLLPITLANKPGAWPRFFRSRNPLRQAAYLLLGGLLEDKQLVKEHFSWVRHGWNDYRLTQAIREFCDYNNAYLIAKGRLKDPIRPQLEAVADKVLYDECHYPATILKAMLVADVCLHFYSTAALEAAYTNTYGICIHRPSPRSRHGAVYPPIYHQLWRKKELGSAYNYQGVNHWMTIPETIQKLPQTPLLELQLQQQARAKYLQKYVGPADGQASQRVLDAILKR